MVKYASSDLSRVFPFTVTTSIGKAGRYAMTASLGYTNRAGQAVTLRGHGEITMTGELGPATGEFRCPPSVAADQAFDIEIRNLKSPEGMYYANSTVLGPVEITAIPAGGGSPVRLSLEVSQKKGGGPYLHVPAGSFPRPGQYTLSATLSVRFNYDGTLRPPSRPAAP